MINPHNIYNILILGAGQLGSRHLQSIKQADIRMNIYVSDICEDSLRLSEARYAEIPENENVENIVFTSDLNLLPETIDFCIIATTAHNRAKLIENLTENRRIDNLILEKVLFQNISDYDRVLALLDSKKINTWVNCPRRTFDIYKALSNELSGKKINMIVDGANWGLGCNSIHFIDLFAFLVSSPGYDIKNYLDNEIIKSKREGYIELTGSLHIQSDNGSQCILTSRNGDAIAGPVIMITSDNASYIIDEAKKTMHKIYRSDKYDLEQIGFSVKYQSQLTAEIIIDITTSGTCDLTTYSESAKLHVPFIREILSFLDENYEKGITNCPIT